MKLSIIIPVYEERSKVGGDILAAEEFLVKQQMSGEIIVVDDGSEDGTGQMAREAADGLAERSVLKVIENPRHRGKGFAVRTGILASSGEFVMFADSGCCVPYDYALRGIEMLERGECDLAHASRKIVGTDVLRDQGVYRHLCSQAFHWFVVLVMGIPRELTDTQCGFKLYRGDIGRELYQECVTDGFMFDIEIVLRALGKGCRIREFAIEWTCDRDSRLRPSRTLWHVLAELWRIRRAIGRRGTHC
jgi:dolichyl-phosphate beta-glucosyltransferase